MNPIPHRHHIVEAVGRKRGQQHLEAAGGGGCLAEAERASAYICSGAAANGAARACHSRAAGRDCTGVARRAVAVRRALGAANRRRYTVSQVAKERVANLLDSLVVDHALSGIHRKAGPLNGVSLGVERWVDEHANLDANVCSGIVNGRGELVSREQSSDHRRPDQQGRPLPVGRLDVSSELTRNVKAPVKGVAKKAPYAFAHARRIAEGASRTWSVGVASGSCTESRYAAEAANALAAVCTSRGA